MDLSDLAYVIGFLTSISAFFSAVLPFAGVVAYAVHLHYKLSEDEEKIPSKEFIIGFAGGLLVLTIYALAK